MASAIIRRGTANAAHTTIKLRLLGSKWRVMMRQFDAPKPRAASMYSRLFKDSADPRMRRASPVQETTASAERNSTKPLAILPSGVEPSVTMMRIRNSTSGKA